MTSLAFPPPPIGPNWNAGREMDIDIAMKLMGWTRPDVPQPGGFDDYLLPPVGTPLNAWGNYRKVPHFSTNLERAFQVAEKLRSLGFAMFVYDYITITSVSADRKWQVLFIGQGRTFAASAPTLWLAICRAALRTP